MKLFKQTNNYKDNPVIKSYLHQINLNYCEKLVDGDVLSIISKTINFVLKCVNSGFRIVWTRKYNELYTYIIEYVP